MEGDGLVPVGVGLASTQELDASTQELDASTHELERYDARKHALESTHWQPKGYLSAA